MFIPPVDDKTEQEILEFIRRRFPHEDNWLTGNCYWFAHILCTVFRLEKYYQPIKGHFVSGDGSRFYDWTGRVADMDEDQPILFDKLWHDDPAWGARIFRDCTR